MTPRISARIAAIAESATLAVDAKAKALKAAGRPVIGFGAGEPDFPTPDYIVEAAAAATKVVANHRYTPTPGLPDLREAIVAKTKRDSNYDITVDQVLVTNGGKQSVYQAFATIIDPGDEVLLPSPFWTTYPECIKLAGGVSVEVFADETQNYLVSVEQVAEKLGLFARVGLFYRQVVSELRKVVWPTRNQLTTYTAVVLVFVSFIIAVVSLIDLVLGRLVFWVFG